MRTSIAPSALIASDCEALAVGCGVQRMLVVWIKLFFYVLLTCCLWWLLVFVLLLIYSCFLLLSV